MVCNAANTPAVLDWLHQWKDPNHRVTLEDRTAATGMIALQGPAAEEHLAALADAALVRTLAYFRWTQAPVVGVQTLLSRTGYTGEDGFELIAPAEHVPALWQALVNSGVMPCGLGARDTLRLEAALPLHGNEITPQTTPVHAGLLWAVALDKGPFLGREAIAKAREEGTAERLVGFEVTGRGIPRPHCPSWPRVRLWERQAAAALRPRCARASAWATSPPIWPIPTWTSLSTSEAPSSPRGRYAGLSTKDRRKEEASPIAPAKALG